MEILLVLSLSMHGAFDRHAPGGPIEAAPFQHGRIANRKPLALLEVRDHALAIDDLHEEPARRLQRGGGVLGDLAVVAWVRKVPKAGEEIQHQVERRFANRLAHIGFEKAHRDAGFARAGSRDFEHRRRQVNPRDVVAAPSEFDRVAAVTTRQIEDPHRRLEMQQRLELIDLAWGALLQVVVIEREIAGAEPGPPPFGIDLDHTFIYMASVESSEVAIIGGGIHGVSAGYHLARMGVKALLFERGGPASGPTGRSSAICRAFYTNRFIAQVAHDSLEMFANFSEISGGRDAGFRRTGDLYLMGAEDLAHVHETVAMLAEIGTEVKLFTSSELGRTYPEMDPEGLAIGALEVNAGYADPVATTQGLFQRAVELGLRSRLYTQVVEIQPRPGGGAILTTADGDRTECERLLIAAGPWTRGLAQQLNVDLPLTVERHWVATFGWNRAKPVPYVMADIPEGYYMKPEGTDLFLVGPLPSEPQADPDGYSTSVTDEEIDRMASAITKRYPALTQADSRGGWASLYDVSPDWQPVIGEIAPGVVVDAGTSGHGFKLAPALGRHTASLVLGKEVDPGIRQFDPRRFEADQLLAAGFGSARIIG